MGAINGIRCRRSIILFRGARSARLPIKVFIDRLADHPGNGSVVAGGEVLYAFLLFFGQDDGSPEFFFFAPAPSS